MRPLEMVMSAFGPYAGCVTLQFDKLGKQGLYLITGDTGAGKTTIFDGIVYALYGKASGQNRTPDMFRSKYADPSTRTEVALTFEYRGKEYFIKRKLEYYRPKLRGNGFTKEDAYVELHYSDGRIITKKEDVENAIKEIIGIDRDQFVQIAMIAQGDFLKVLVADTKDRKIILQKLFHTEMYNDLQERLKTDTSNLKKENEKADDSIKQYINGIACEEEDELSVDVKKAKSNELTMEEKVNLIKQLIEKDQNKKNQKDKEIELLEEKISNCKKILDIAENQQQTEDLMKQSLEDLAKEESAFKSYKEVKDALEKRKPESKALNERAIALNQQLPEYSELDEKQNQLIQLKEEFESEKLKITENEKSIADETDKLDALKEEQKGLSGIEAQKTLLETEQEKLTRITDNIKTVKEDLQNIESLEKQLKIKQQDYLNKQTTAQRLKHEYDEKYTAYLNEQAGILAETLIEGHPCPVCGSIHHPLPASKSEDAPTREELDVLKNKREEAERSEKEASEQAGTIKNKIEEKKSTVVRSTSQLFGIHEYSEISILLQNKETEVNKQNNTLNEAINAVQAEIERKTELDRLIPKCQDYLESLKSRQNELRSCHAVTKTKQENANKRIEELKEKLQCSSKAEAEDMVNELRNAATEIDEAIKNAEDDLKKCEIKIAELKSAISSSEKILKDRVSVNLEELNEEHEKLINDKNNNTEIIQKVKTRLTINSGILRNISSKYEEKCDIESRLQWVKALSETANGSIPGKEKIMLETYIQMTYFERIIRRANIRLNVMTNGQYELVRRKTADNNRSQSGLDLDVIDHNNGSTRSVNSLSGGESFKASLSLALGLSDEIQSSAGGIQLDTMFVDEGFGSLDEESLQQAIDALAGLSEGNKLVGIISHVSELKNRIDKQIIVKKDKLRGSSFEIMVD